MWRGVHAIAESYHVSDHRFGIYEQSYVYRDVFRVNVDFYGDLGTKSWFWPRSCFCCLRTAASVPDETDPGFGFVIVESTPDCLIVCVPLPLLFKRKHLRKTLFYPTTTYSRPCSSEFSCTKISFLLLSSPENSMRELYTKGFRGPNLICKRVKMIPARGFIWKAVYSHACQIRSKWTA